MRLSKLSLSNYRNFGDSELEFGPGLSVIQGMNGQGKSNLLEAVYLLSVARSPRASQDRDLVGWDILETGGHSQVAGVAREKEQTTKIQIDFETAPPGGGQGRGGPENASVQKSLRVNGVKCPASDFVGNFNVVAFAVEDIDMVTGGPAVRRRYLDILISQGDASYLKALQRYQRVTTQRNSMLRLIRDRQAAPGELTFWDERLCEEGAAIVEKRSAAVERLRDHALGAHEALAQEDSALTIEYRPALGPAGPATSMVARQLSETLSRSLGIIHSGEMARGVTLVGPHRDELELGLGGRNAGTFASRGQARTIALALKHGEGRLVAEATGRNPVLALDDVLSELDRERRRLVLDAASVFEQVLVTTTDLSLIDADILGRAEKFHVDDGGVARMSA